MVLKAAPKKKPTPAEKRRHGQHHKQSKHYHNTYWPYLPLAFIVGLGVLVNSLWPTMQSAVLGYATNTSSNGLLLATNEERTTRGLGTLALNARLTAAAQAKANDMAARDYWSHDTPEGNQPWVFIKNAGYAYQSAGENLAYGFEGNSNTVAGWMGSTPHRINLLGASYNEVGFGIAHAEDFQGTGPQTIVVAMYAQRAASAPPVIAQSQAPPAPTESEEKVAASPKQPTAPRPSDQAAAKAERPAQQATTPAQRQIQSALPTAESPQTQQVSRVDVISGENSAWAMFAITVIASAAAGIFLLRHSLFWHRVLVKGERFAARHHFLDIVMVGIATLAVVLTRAAGTIY